MKKELNISEILKDKPKGIRLYSPIFGDCTFSFIQGVTDAICVIANDNREFFDYKGLYSPIGECLLFPSKSMRDWSKFDWKRGDVLVSNDGKREVLFKTWVNDSYTKFVGLHCLIINDNEEVEYDNGTTVFNTNDFKGIEAEDAVQTYINTIEERFGGKINRETLEVEKPQPEFKDGDIAFVESHMLGINTSLMIAIFRKEKEVDKYKFSPALCESNVHDTYLREYPVVLSPSDIKTFRPATDSEKQQLFDALEKEGKAWDAEKKVIVDLKPKVGFKPFDKVVVRNTEESIWQADFFSHIDVDYRYACVGATWSFCIPYNEETAKLIGTTNNVEG